MSRAVAATDPDALAVAAEFGRMSAILDIGLPGMDGYELARRLRERASANPFDRADRLRPSGDLRAATAAGFDAHCAKPIAIAALLALIAGEPA